MAYTPVDNTNQIITDSPNASVASVIGDRLAENGFHSFENRKFKQTCNFHAGPSNNTNIVGGGYVTANDLTGYFPPGAIVGNPETIGVQFSTHPSHPLHLTFPFLRSAGGGKIKVRFACKVEQAPVDVYVFSMNAEGPTFKPVVPNFSTNGSTFQIGASDPGLGITAFQAGVTIQPSYISVPVFNPGVNETDGMQFYEVEITDYANTDGEAPVFANAQYEGSDSITDEDFERRYRSDIVGIAFCSRTDDLGGIAKTIALDSPTLGPAIKYSNKVITITDKGSGLPNGWGKYHYHMKVTGGRETGVDTWHHVMGAFPRDPTDPVLGNVDTDLAVWPQVPNTADPATFSAGQTVELYPAGKMTLYSVTIQEEEI